MKIQHRSEKATEREQILSSVFYSILRIYEKLLTLFKNTLTFRSSYKFHNTPLETVDPEQ